jgi:hypothetical protein
MSNRRHIMMMKFSSARAAGRGTRAVLVGGGAVLLNLAVASAATPPAGDSKPDPFNLLDHDSNGLISYSEAQSDPALTREFNDLDKDKDGELDKGEFAQFEAQGLTDRPGILPPEPSEHVEKAPPLPPETR